MIPSAKKSSKKRVLSKNAVTEDSRELINDTQKVTNETR